MIVIDTVVAFWFGLPSFAVTVIVFAPGFRLTDWLQFAVPNPLAVPPLAAIPFTVTDEMPLLPRPESLAVPATVIGVDVTVWLFVGLAIVNVGPKVSVNPDTTAEFISAWISACERALL